MTRPHHMRRLLAKNTSGVAAPTAGTPAPASPNAGGTADGGGPDFTSPVGPISPLFSPNGHDIRPSRQVGDSPGYVSSTPSCNCAAALRNGRHREECARVAEIDAFDALIARAAARLTEGAA